MNVVIAGHVDHGKSTLIGRLLYDSGNLPESRLSEMQAMCEEYRKKFEFSSFLDAFSDEVKEERTIDTTEVIFKGENLHTLIDVPGHLEFIEAMLTGASHAEAAVIVVDVTKGLEEQTKRHLNLIKLLGIKTIVFAINKMDLVDYNQDVFLACCKDILEFNKLGCYYIPISAFKGDNIYSKSENTPWNSGYTVVGYLDALESILPRNGQQAKFIVQGAYKGWILGSGNLKEGQLVYFEPSKLTGKILEVDESRAIRYSGEVPVRGDIGSIYRLKVSSRLWCSLFLLEGTLKVGSELELRCGTKQVGCRVLEVSKRISSETGLEILGDKLAKQDSGTVVLSTEPIVVERFEDDPELGRFTLSKRGKNIAVGVVLNYE